MILRKLKNFIKPHKTIPAPEVLEYDPWFGHPPETERSISIAEAKQKAIEDKQILSHSDDNYDPLHNNVVEPEDIHQKMYDIATKGVATTLALNPMPPLGGGSENFQEGPGGWNSGTGMAQFK
jgi:hypothetical protein